MAFVEFIGSGNGNSPVRLLMNTDRIDAVNEVENGAKCGIFVGGSDTPFWVDQPYTRVVEKLQECGQDVTCYDDEYKSVCRMQVLERQDELYNNFVKYVKQIKETVEDK